MDGVYETHGTSSTRGGSGLPAAHHTEWDCSRQTFFGEEDYRAYMDLMSEWGSKQWVDIRAYCLMPNHVHLIAVPQSMQGSARAIGGLIVATPAGSTFAKVGEDISGRVGSRLM